MNYIRRTSTPCIYSIQIWSKSVNRARRKGKMQDSLLRPPFVTHSCTVIYHREAGIHRKDLVRTPHAQRHRIHYGFSIIFLTRRYQQVSLSSHRVKYFMVLNINFSQRNRKRLIHSNLCAAWNKDAFSLSGRCWSTFVNSHGYEVSRTMCGNKTETKDSSTMHDAKSAPRPIICPWKECSFPAANLCFAALFRNRWCISFIISHSCTGMSKHWDQGESGEAVSSGRTQFISHETTVRFGGENNTDIFYMQIRVQPHHINTSTNSSCFAMHLLLISKMLAGVLLATNVYCSHSCPDNWGAFPFTWTLQCKWSHGALQGIRQFPNWTTQVNEWTDLIWKNASTLQKLL